MNILFKCDQSNFIGLGHYYRCLALSKEFKKDKHKCFFLGLKLNNKKNHITIKNEKDDLKFTQEFIKKQNKNNNKRYLFFKLQMGKRNCYEKLPCGNR